MGTLNVDLSTCVIFISSGTSYSGGRLNPGSSSGKTDFLVPVEVAPDEDLTVEVDFLGGDNSAVNIHLKLYATELADGNGDSFIQVADKTTVGSSVGTPYTLSTTLPADSPTAWASAAAVGPIYLEVLLVRSNPVTAVRLTQASLGGGSSEAFVPRGYGFSVVMEMSGSSIPAPAEAAVPIRTLAESLPVPTVENGRPT